MSQRRARRVLVTCFGIMGTEIGVWGSRIPEVRLQANLSYGALGWALFAIPAGTVASLPFVNLIVRRFDIRTVVWVAASISPLLLVPLGFTRHFAALLPELFLFGAALCLLNVSVNAGAVAVQRSYGRPLMTSFHAAFSIGAVGGAALGGSLSIAGLTAESSFMVVGFGLVVVGFLTGHEWWKTHEEAPPVSKSTPVRHTLRLNRSRPVVALGVLAMCVAAAEGAMIDWSAVFMHDEVSASAGLASATLAAFSAAVTVGRLVGDRLVRRFGAVRVVRSSGVIGGAGLTVGAFSDHAITAFAGFILVGLGVACVVPQIISAAGDLPIGHSSTNIAVVTGLSTVGNLGGPVVVGTAAAHTGLPSALAILAALMAVVAAGASYCAPRSGMPARPKNDAAGGP